VAVVAPKEAQLCTLFERFVKGENLTVPQLKALLAEYNEKGGKHKKKELVVQLQDVVEGTFAKAGDMVNEAFTASNWDANKILKKPSTYEVRA